MKREVEINQSNKFVKNKGENKNMSSSMKILIIGILIMISSLPCNIMCNYYISTYLDVEKQKVTNWFEVGQDISEFIKYTRRVEVYHMFGTRFMNEDEVIQFDEVDGKVIVEMNDRVYTEENFSLEINGEIWKFGWESENKYSLIKELPIFYTRIEGWYPEVRRETGELKEGWYIKNEENKDMSSWKIIKKNWKKFWNEVYKTNYNFHVMKTEKKNNYLIVYKENEKLEIYCMSTKLDVCCCCFDPSCGGKCCWCGDKRCWWQDCYPIQSLDTREYADLYWWVSIPSNNKIIEDVSWEAMKNGFLIKLYLLDKSIEEIEITPDKFIGKSDALHQVVFLWIFFWGAALTIGGIIGTRL